MVRLISQVKEALSNAAKAVSSKEEMKKLLGISLYRNAFYLMLNSAALAITGFAFWIIAAWFYEPEGVGFASVTISAIVLYTGTGRESCRLPKGTSSGRPVN